MAFDLRVSLARGSHARLGATAAGKEAVRIQGGKPMIVSQLMSRNLETCHPQDSLEDAARKMWDCDIGCLPVLDGEAHVVGIVTDRDACMAAFTQGRPLSAISVDSAMAHQVFSCMPTDRIEDVEGVMKTHQVRRVPVIDEQGRLMGLVSMNDIARESARDLGAKAPEVAAGELISTLASICVPRQPLTN